MKINVNGMGYKPIKSDPRKVKEGVDKMREALERDYWESLKKPSGLPKDWRNRVIRYSSSPESQFPADLSCFHIPMDY
jgi:hypothetical protein